MNRIKTISCIAPEVQEGTVTRRSLLQRTAAIGVSAAAATPLWARSAKAAVGRKVQLKFGYTSTPANPVSVGYEHFASLVRERSAGDVNVTTFCCNELGNDQELVQSAQSGALQMGTSSNNNLDQFTSTMMVLELPYLIRTREAYRKFWNTSSDEIRHEFETKLGLKILTTGELVQSGDEQVPLLEGIPSSGCFNHVSAQDVEVQIELLVKLLLPLLHKAPWRDDQAAVEVTAEHQLTDVKARHDGFTSAGVISQKKSQGQKGQQAVVDGVDLMWQGLDGRGLDGREWVKEMGKLDPASLRCQFE